MRWLIDASAARRYGALTHHMELVPAFDDLLEGDHGMLLSTPNLADGLHGKVRTTEVRVVPTSEGFKRYYALNFPIRRIIGKFRPDAVLFGQYAPIGYHRPYVLRLTDAHLIDEPNRRVVMKSYGRLQQFAWLAKKISFITSLRSAHAVICATQTLADLLMVAYPSVDPAKIVVCSYGLSGLAQMPIRHNPPRSKRLLTMHVAPHKNIEVVLRAMATPELDGWTLTLLAQLDSEDTPYGRYLRRLIDELGLEERVHQAGYISNRDDLARRVAEHDILVCTSRIESWSHTVVEGMALGMPVVASDIPCHREVSDGAAWLVGCDDPMALAEAVTEIARGGARVRQRIELGKKVTKRYSWEGYAETCMDLLRNAARNHAS